MNKVQIAPGQMFHRWTVIGPAEFASTGRTYWICRCSCGTVKPVVSLNLRSGTSKSCGCWNVERARERAMSRNKKHGHTKRGTASSEYVSWCSMKNRCKHSYVNGYEYYGGRGIKVCDRWLHSFEAFLSDMGPKPSPAHTLDRIENDLDYEPSNCRWATPSEQRLNQRRNTNRKDNVHVR